MYSENMLVESGLLDLVHEAKIRRYLSKAATNKACSSDGIHILLLKSLAETEFPKLLQDLYVACIRSGSTPTRWNETLVYPLRKSPDLPYTATNTRPISIVCQFRKIFETLLLPAVNTSLDTSFGSCQAGFRSGYSTLTNLLTLNNIIEDKQYPHIVFLDFKAAFDCVQWYKLATELKDQGMNTILLNLIYHLMYKDMKFSLIVNGSQSRDLQRTTGLPQGSPLSPILFNRFLSGLLKTLNQNADQVPHCLFFADDGVIIAKSNAEAQQLLNIANSWADQHLMSFNVTKCGHLYCGTPGYAQKQPLLTIAQQPIPLVTSYKYLGIPVGRFGIQFDEHATQLATKATKLQKEISWQSHTWSPRTRYNIFRSIMLPTMQYALPLHVAHFKRSKSYAGWKVLETAYKSGIGWIAGSQAQRPLVTGNLLGLMEFASYSNHLFIRFYHHLASMAKSNPLHQILTRIGWASQDGIKRRGILYNRLLAEFLLPPPEYRHAISKHSRHESISFNEILSSVLKNDKQNRIIQLGPHAGTLQHVASLGSRLENSYLDGIFIAPSQEQSKLFAWRRGVFGWGRKCVCGIRFTRGHESCMPYDPGILQPDEELDFNLETQLLPDDTNYTRLDYLINHRHFTRAITILDFWIATMSSHLQQG